MGHVKFKANPSDDPSLLIYAMPRRTREMEDPASRVATCVRMGPSAGFEWALLPTFGVSMRDFGFKLG